jgi:hypothetical protein
LVQQLQHDQQPKRAEPHPKAKARVRSAVSGARDQQNRSLQKVKSAQAARLNIIVGSGTACAAFTNASVRTQDSVWTGFSTNHFVESTSFLASSKRSSRWVLQSASKELLGCERLPNLFGSTSGIGPNRPGRRILATHR